MDARHNLIIAKGKSISSDVSSCLFNSITQKWDITFKNGKTFQYNQDNVVILKNPIILDPKNYIIYSNGRRLDNITEIYDYKGLDVEYWYICFSNGYENVFDYSDLRVNKSVLTSSGAKEVFKYLCEVVDCISVRSESDDTAILSKQYERIEYLGGDTAAAAYLDPEKYEAETDLDYSAPIFPFGCNQSQFQAVRNALSNRISIIEGPPGTGKTQTILNIIANLVMQGKSVQVVSNNNSAIDNIVEKFASSKYQMDFMVARLGRDERKEEFIKSQKGSYPDFSDWHSEDYNSENFAATVYEKSLQLKEIFHDTNRLAELRQELYVIQIERSHLRDLVEEKEIFITRKMLPSAKIMEFWQEFQDILDGKQKANILFRISKLLFERINVGKLLKEGSGSVLSQLQFLYYEARLREVESEIANLKELLEKTNSDKLVEEFTNLSLSCFRATLANRFSSNKHRKVYAKEDLWQKTEDFIREYPVVLSTTYTARSSLGKNAHFDYVIMDEASQVDIATGMLALSCASNAVIVGDTKQLQNVVTSQQQVQLNTIFDRHDINSSYDFAQHSFLSSIYSLLGDCVPKVTLCEHYRCHPQIIGFCNQKFYNNALIIMNSGYENSALQLVTTVAGNHERDHMNQRQIDVIKYDILPKLDCSEDEIGIIAPYRNQVIQLNKELENTRIEVDTVHKFQGREKDVIILSIVDDVVKEFSDDPNLLNVAVSRAKKKLIIVTGDQAQPLGSNVGDLIGYIRYNNCDIQHSDISSVFDYLYCQYEEKRNEYLKRHRRISKYDSENLMNVLILEELEKRGDSDLGVISHYPLQLLFRDLSKMNDEERNFVNTGLSHLDFIIYNKVSKQPLLAVEVDGFNYHKDGTKQADRDKLKNHILEVYHLPLLRFRTNGSGEREKLSKKLDEIMRK